MALIIGLLVLGFVVAVLVVESPLGRRFVRRRRDSGWPAWWAGDGGHDGSSGSDCGGGFFGGDFGGGGGGDGGGGC